jgi:hypothetical protein
VHCGIPFRQVPDIGGCGHVARCRLHCAQIVERLGKTGPCGNGPVEAIERPGSVTEAVQQIAQIVQAVRIGGITLDGGSIGRLRLCQPSLGFQRPGKSTMAGDIPRSQSDDAAKARLRLAPSAEQAQAYSAAIQKSGIIGAARERLLAGLDHLGRLVQSLKNLAASLQSRHEIGVEAQGLVIEAESSLCLARRQLSSAFSR